MRLASNEYRMLYKNKVLILGGYGNFGRRIAARLVYYHIPIIVAGRHVHVADEVKAEIIKKYPDADIETAAIDIQENFENHLRMLKPYIVINTCGPFQSRNYDVARCCIQERVHYIDLADGRDFVCGISTLEALAKANQVCVISGASTVPGLSSAVLMHYQQQFSSIASLRYGITPGQRAPIGIATAQSILSYLGRPIKTLSGPIIRYGWQNLYRQAYPEIGHRWMSNCDIPDLDLFLQYYHIPDIQFSAGMENSLVHLGLWGLSWLVRWGVPLSLQKHAKLLLDIKALMNLFGTDNGGMHMIIKGNDKNEKPLTIKWFMIALRGDGPQIPCVPAIILTRKLLSNTMTSYGAKPCVGLISLQEYQEELKDYAIHCVEQKEKD